MPPEEVAEYRLRMIPHPMTVLFRLTRAIDRALAARDAVTLDEFEEVVGVAGGGGAVQRVLSGPSAKSVNDPAY